MYITHNGINVIYIYTFISYHIIDSYIIYINTFIYIDMQDQIV